MFDLVQSISNNNKICLQIIQQNQQTLNFYQTKIKTFVTLFNCSTSRDMKRQYQQKTNQKQSLLVGRVSGINKNTSNKQNNTKYQLQNKISSQFQSSSKQKHQNQHISINNTSSISKKQKRSHLRSTQKQRLSQSIDKSNKHSNHNPLSNSNQILLNKRIVSPQKLKILVLSGNQLKNDQLQFLSKCINLIKLDLSHNHVTKLHERFGIKNIKNLKVLLLDSNNLRTIQAIQQIFGMKSLNLLSIKDNLLQQNPKSQHLIVNNFPQLKVINQRIVFIQQRDFSQIIQRKNQYISKDFDDWIPVQHSQKYYLRVLRLQLQYIDNMWMFHNPIVKIQRVYRAIIEQEMQIQRDEQENNQSTTIRLEKVVMQKEERKTRNNKNKGINGGSNNNDNQKHLYLTKIFEEWRKTIQTVKQIRRQLAQTLYEAEEEQYNQQHYNRNRSKHSIIIMKNKEHLTFDIKEYYRTKRNLKIQKDLQYFIQKIREKLYIRKMAERLRRNINLKISSFADPLTSYVKLSGLSQTKKIYFNRVQQHLIQNFLAHISKNFNKSKQIYKEGKFGIGSQYVAVRLMDPDTYANKTNYGAFTYLMWPCMRAVILKKKKFPFKLKSSIIKIKALSYIKNRDKKLSPQNIKKSNKTYARIDRFFQHQYNQGLGYFQCKDQFILQHLVRMIYYHNTKSLTFEKIIQRSEMMSLLESYTQCVSIYTQKLLQRTTSAVKIQQQWRRYINNKRQKQSIYDKLKKNRACRLIQRFMRDRVFAHRLNFQKRLSLDLTIFDGQKDLVLTENLYKRLPYIMEQAAKHVQLYAGFKIKIQDKIYLEHDDFDNKEIFFPTLRNLHLASQRFSRENLVVQSVNNNIINKGSRLFGIKQNRPASQKVDIYKFFHQDANTKIIQCKGQKFYQFTYSSVESAKFRAACLALLTYRIYGSTYMLPLSKSTLYMYNQRLQVYKEYGVSGREFQINTEQQNLNKLKVNLLSDVNEQSRCPFVFIDPIYESLFVKKGQSQTERNNFNKLKATNVSYQNTFTSFSIPIQFYQKKYQDYPLKYESKLYVKLWPDEQGIENQRIKLLTLNKFIGNQKDSINIRISKYNSSNTKINVINSLLDSDRNTYHHKEILSDNRPKIQKLFQQEKPLFLGKSNSKQPSNHKLLEVNLNKTYQKQLSLYQLDSPATLIQIARQFDTKNKTQNLQKTFAQQTQLKKQKINKYLQGQRQKKQLIRQKKQLDLGLIRQKRKQQKIMNITLKSFHQSQRTQILRKKTQKIKQYKRRSLSSNNKLDQSDFLQQGNFIMQQHLKMNLMRNKVKEIQKLRQKRTFSQTKNLINNKSLRQHSDDSRSQHSTKPVKNNLISKKKMLFDDNIDTVHMDIHNNKVVIESSDGFQKHQVFGGQTQIVNKKSFVKKRSSKTGAYLRDPSYVHGVFPEEYYPIQTTKGGIMFPRVI